MLSGEETSLVCRSVSADHAETPQASQEELDDCLTHVANGDRGAFAALYDALASQLMGVVMQTLCDRSQSEEIVQEVFVEVWRTAPSFDRDLGGARSWILRLARMRAVDRLRSWTASMSRDDRDAKLREVISPVPVDEQAFTRIAGDRVRQALDGIGEPHRTAVGLSYLAGLSHQEVAVTTGVPLGTAKSRVRDGLGKLRSVLEKGGK